MSSNEFMHRFVDINNNIKRKNREYKRGQVDCQLCHYEDCNPITRKNGHSEWNCYKYNSPLSIRDHLIQSNRCRACANPLHCHDDVEGSSISGCSTSKILSINRGDNCRRCGEIDHIFWTCDGSPHPGSQFKITKKVDKTESKIDKCTQHNAKEIEQNCKNPTFINKTDPNKIVEKEMESDLKNENLFKSQSSNTSTKSAPSYIDDKLVKLESKFESNLNKKIESVMLEIQALKESVVSRKKFDKEKCLNNKDIDLDQDTENYIKDLETKLSEKDNLIKSQKDEIEQLNLEKANMSKQFSNDSQNWIQQTSNFGEVLQTKDEKLKVYEKLNKRHQQEVEELINLLVKIFPSMKDIDTNLDNEAVIKIIEKLIEEQKSDSLRNKTAVEKVKEVSNDKEIIIQKEAEIESLKYYIKEHESNNVSNKKILGDIRKILKQERESSIKLEEGYKMHINTLNCQIKDIQTDLGNNKSKTEDSHKKVLRLEKENEQLIEKIESLEDSKNQLDTLSENSSEKSLNISKKTSNKGEELNVHVLSAQEYSDGNEEYPYGSEEYPYGSEEYPYGSEEYPYGNEEYPDDNDEYFDDNDEYFDENEGYFYESENFDENEGYIYESENFDENTEGFDDHMQESDKHDECAENDEDILKVEKSDDLYIGKMMVTNKKGEKVMLRDIIYALSDEENEMIYKRFTIRTKRENIYDNLKFFGKIIT